MTQTAQLKSLRQFYAQLVTANAGVPPTQQNLIDAFASTPREKFAGAGPWQVFTRIGYIQTPSDDPALLYQDITIALKPAAQINNGQPTLHALCLAVLDVQAGETIVQIGAGTGYYTAILATLTGSAGTVHAYEIDRELAARAEQNLADYPQATVHPASASEGALPASDVIYVNAGATAPLNTWLDALSDGGRLLFPLTPDAGVGGMLLVTRIRADAFAAQFICGAMFIPCVGARDEETAAQLSVAFQRGDMAGVRSLQRATTPDETCWCAGQGWWLSTKEP